MIIKMETDTNSAEDDNVKIMPDTEFKTYKRRWFMLMVVSLLSLSNAMIWITFSPIADSVVTFYNISSLEVNMLSLVYLIASVPFGFAASWLLDTLGLRASIIVSAWLNGVGAFLRNLSTLIGRTNSSRFAVLMVGQSLAACAQPFVMFAPTKLAALWFPDSQRATANMVASMANPLGILLANVIVPAVVKQQDDIPKALWAVSAPAYLLMLIATFGVCTSVPPTPPTSSAAEESESFGVGLKKIARNKNYWMLNIAFGAGLAVFTALTSFLDQILCPRGYTDDFAGLCGAVMIAAGLVGAIFAGLYVDRTKKFEEVTKLCFGMSALSGVFFTQISRLRHQSALIVVSVVLVGGFGFAAYPIAMELCVESTYPVAEATSSGMAVISGQLQGIILMFLMQFIAQDLPESEKSLPTGCSTNSTSSQGFTPQDWTVPNLAMNVVICFAAVLFILTFKAEYKRMLQEQRQKAEKIMSISAEISN